MPQHGKHKQIGQIACYVMQNLYWNFPAVSEDTFTFRKYDILKGIERVLRDENGTEDLMTKVGYNDREIAEIRSKFFMGRGIFASRMVENYLRYFRGGGINLVSGDGDSAKYELSNRAKRILESGRNLATVNMLGHYRK